MALDYIFHGPPTTVKGSGGLAALGLDVTNAQLYYRDDSNTDDLIGWQPIGSGGGGGAVSSVFGRIGVVVAQANDYSGIDSLLFSDASGTSISFAGSGNINISGTGKLNASGMTEVDALIFNATTGFRISGAGATGQFLRGNGTSFVSSSIQSGDVPNIAESQVTNLVSDLAGKVPTTTTVNSHALSGNITLSASDLTTGTLPHAQLPPLVTADVPAGGSSTQIQFNDGGVFSGSDLTWDKINKILTVPSSVAGVGVGTGFDAAGSSATATATVTINVGDFVVVIGGGTGGTVTLTDNGTALALTSVQVDANGNSVYQGTVTGGANNAHVGKTIVIAGFTNGTNNGTFLVTGSTATSLTVNNLWAITEIHAGTASNGYIAITGTSTVTEQLWICSGALVSATTVTVGAPTNPSVAAASFTGIGGVGAFNRATVTATPGSTSITTTAANSLVVSGFLYVSTAGTMTATANTGTLRTNSDAGTNTVWGTAIVTTQTTTVGSVTQSVNLNRSATTGFVWTLELLPAGTAFSSDTLKLQTSYYNGSATVTDSWGIQAIEGPTSPYLDGFFNIGNAQNSPARTGGDGKTISGAVPTFNKLQFTFSGEGGGMISTPPQNVVGSINLQKLADPATPVVTPTGGSATTWGYKIVAFDANNMCTAASAQGTTTTGASGLTSAAFNTVTWTAVTGASYYNIYRTQSPSGVVAQIGQIAAGQTLSFVDDGAIVGVSQTPSNLNWTGGFNLNGTWLASNSANPAGGTPPGVGGGLNIFASTGAFGSFLTGYQATPASTPNSYGTSVGAVFQLGFGNTSDANDRIQLAATATGWGLCFQHARTTALGDPGFLFGGNGANAGNFTPTSGTATEFAIGFIGSEQSSALCKFSPAFGSATYNVLRISPTIQQTLVTTGITNANVTSATAAVLTVTSGVGFVNGATIVIAGCTGTNNAQLNGTWTIASGGGTTSITITGSGWVTGNNVETTGTLSQQATGNYNGILFNVTETAVGGAATGNKLLDLQVGGVSQLNVDSRGHVLGNGNLRGTVSSGSGTTVSVTYTNAFASTPLVTVTPTTNAGAFFLSASSTTGFTITYATTGAQTFNWHAIA